MQTEATATRTPAQQMTREASRGARQATGGRAPSDMARHAAAATELPFSALFYWID